MRLIRPCCFRAPAASTRATYAPVTEAQRVPPSAWRTSQSIQTVRSPSRFVSPTARGAGKARRVLYPVFPQTFRDPLRHLLAELRPQHPPRRRVVTHVAALDEYRRHPRIAQDVEAALVARGVRPGAAVRQPGSARQM